jgi:hypothetical protein
MTESELEKVKSVCIRSRRDDGGSSRGERYTRHLLSIISFVIRHSCFVIAFVHG